MAQRLFLFCIGGTGSRVLKSLVMLLASGVDMGNFNEVIPVIIDPDITNGDKERTEAFLKQYNSIHNNLNNSEKCSFFKTEIKPISELSVQKGGNPNKIGYCLDIPETQNSSFGDYISYQSLPANDPNKYLIELLFSDENLNAGLDHGFTGSPNMGSIVLNIVSESQTMNEIAQLINAGDRIFIVSSIFGGTGAAGFPLLLKNIRQGIINGKTHDTLKKAEIGAISVHPYFKVNSKDPSAKIDSNNFITKTKAALHYYEKNLSGLDNIYYVGDVVSKGYPYAEGKKDQENDAHFIELISALAIVDFAKSQQVGDQGKTLCKEFGVDNDATPLTFNDLNVGTTNIIKRPMTQYLYFNLFLRDHLKGTNLKHPYANCYDPKLNKKFFNDDEDRSFKILQEFNSAFRIWLGEMSRNAVSFSPFDITIKVDAITNKVIDIILQSDDYLKLVKAIESDGVAKSKAKNSERIIKALNKAAMKVGSYKKEDNLNANKRLLEVFSIATENLLKSKSN